jgi:hypothetical protein
MRLPFLSLQALGLVEQQQLIPEQPVLLDFLVVSI